MTNLSELKENLAKAELAIEQMKAQIAELEKPKVKQWEPKGGEWWITPSQISQTGSTKGARLFGVERETKELAEKAAKEMRFFNRLLAYRDEFAPDYNPDWSNSSELKSFIFYNHETRYWEMLANTRHVIAGVVYMPEDVAEELVRKLNAGEVVL